MTLDRIPENRGAAATLLDLQSRGAGAKNPERLAKPAAGLGIFGQRGAKPWHRRSGEEVGVSRLRSLHAPVTMSGISSGGGFCSKAGTTPEQLAAAYR
jgi:hypothetical protein